MNMKTINNKYLAIIVALVLMSCSDDFFDVNESENDPSESKPELTLPVAQKFSADYISGGYNSPNTLGNIWTQAWTAAGDYIYFTDEMQYNVTSGFRTSTFQTAYLNPLDNYDYVEHFGENSESGGAEFGYYRAIAKIMKAYHYQYLVDIYGDVPYTEALQGKDNATPAYDSGQSIYDNIYDQITEAISLIQQGLDDAGTENEIFQEIGNEDVMYGGNMTMWAKFGNSLRLRILLRQSELSNNLTSKYTALDASPFGYLGAGENAYVNPGYVLQAGKQNPLWDAFGETSAGNLAANAEATRATIYAIEKLRDEFNDPRLSRLYAPASAPEDPAVPFVGIEQNDQNANSPKSAELSGIGPGILKGPDQNAIIMQSAESLFLQAEAAQRGFIAGNAQALYEAAISESFTQLGATGASAYYAQGINNVSWNASSDKIEAIITQKWIALNGTNGIENWIEYKRTGFPADLPAAPNALQSTIPIRLLYPSSEAANNPGNVPSQISADAFNSPVFWDM